MRVTKLITILGIAWTSVHLIGCADPVDDINRVNLENVFSKDVFQGEWYFAQTVVDSPYEAGGTFVGDRQEYLLGAEDFPATKIRWRLTQTNLLACRVDDIIVGSNLPGRTAGDELDPNKAEARRRNSLDPSDPDYMDFPCTNPIASFPIRHMDINRAYNAATGEQSNVIVPNPNDRMWYDRKFVQVVMWANSGIPELNLSLAGGAGLGWHQFGRGTGYQITPQTNDCRSEIVPGVMNYSQCQEGFLPDRVEDTDEDGITDSIMLTHRIHMAPSYFGYTGLFGCFLNSIYGAGGTCANAEIGMRTHFLRVPQRDRAEQYEPLYYSDVQFERAGVWRVIKNTFEPGRGQTDFRQFLGTRFKIWKETQTCDDDGTCTPLPIIDREFNPIVYHLNREFPADLKKAAFEIGKEWNDAFNGIHPTIDLEDSCKIKCAAGTKDYADCTYLDENWTMEGTCAFKVVENSGNEFLGDLRYNYMAYIEDPGSRTPCGIGGPANDPETGELINAVSYVYGGSCFDFIETRMADLMDVLCASYARRDPNTELPRACQGIDENQYLRGVRVLDIMQAQGYVRGPSVPIRGLTQANYSFTSDEAAERFDNIREIAEQASHNRAALHHGAQKAREAGLSRMMVPDELAREVSGGLAQTGADLTDDELELVDPLKPHGNGMSRQEKLRNRLASRALETEQFIFNDDALWQFVNQYKDYERPEMLRLFREQMFKATTLHEIGHNVGLRHNFIASFDRANYFPPYWDIIEEANRVFEAENGRPPITFEPSRDSDETPDDFTVRSEQWDADNAALRVIKDSLGIRQYRYSSIMDYHGTLYGDWQGLGSYDKSAIRFIYGGLVDRVECEGQQPEDCLTKDEEGVRALHKRSYVKWYHGGELCRRDTDCPMVSHGQQCRLNEANGARFCSNWDDDEAISGRYNPRQAFCSDDRVADQPFCNRFDSGETSEEIVQNAIQSYEQGFIRNNFRHYRASFSIRSYYGRMWSRYFSVIGNQMQSLLFKYYFEPGFRSKNGPGGFYDMFRATIRGFDFISNVLAQPEAGSYEWDEDQGVYTFLDKELVDNNIAGDEVINIPLGQGKTLWSSYERGYFGETDRLSYIGVFYDKLLALQALTFRDWGADAGQNDQRFQLSFYDFFPGAYLNVLGSLISGDYDNLGLTYENSSGVLEQRTFWDGSFFGDEVELSDELLDPPGRRIRPGASSLLNVYSLIYGYIYTPAFFDLSFINEGRVFEVGGETGFDISHLNGRQYTECVSPLTGRRFVAVHTVSVRESIAQRTMARCIDLSQKYRTLDEAIIAHSQDPSVQLPDGMDMDQAEREFRTARMRLSNHEDTMSNIVRIIDIVGVGSL